MKKIERFLDKNENFILALDGEAASGKGTLSKKLARNHNFFYCPTSILYRKLAQQALVNNIEEIGGLVDIASSLDNFSEDSSLYTVEVSRKSSEIASIREVREALDFYQRNILKIHKRVLMEGRDIGTVIAPHADVKLYIIANIDERAQRRFVDLTIKNPSISMEEVKKDLIKRDEQDKNRKNAPLAIAEDAIVLDSSYFNVDEFYEEVVKAIMHKYADIQGVDSPK